MYPANRRIVSKERAADLEQDSTSPEAQQMGNAYNPNLGSYAATILGNRPTFPSSALPQISTDGQPRATVSDDPTRSSTWLVTGKVACHTCQQRKGKCSGQNDRQPIQHHLKCDYCAENGLQCIWKPPRRTIAKASSRQRPTTAGSSSSAPGQGDRSQVQTKSACVACQKRKQRCTGERPACKTCADKGYTCSYDVADGKTRSEDLKFKIQEAEEREAKLMQLVSAMQHGTKEQSSSLLARLRMGASLENLLKTETNVNDLNASTGIFQAPMTEAAQYMETNPNIVTTSTGILQPLATDVAQYSGTHPYQVPSFPSNLHSEASFASEYSQNPFTEQSASSFTYETPLSAASSYSFDFPMAYPRLSVEDIEEANDPFKQAFPPQNYGPR